MKLEKFLAVIKLTSGEEVVARISELENMDKILIDSPAMMNCTAPSRRPGINMIKIEPWIKSGKETTYIIDMSKVITTSEIFDEDVTEAYDKFVDAYYNGVEMLPPRGMSRDMGYISNVKDARMSLEKLFKDS
jgi:uncharacterized protein (UPF0297 family)